MMKVSALHFSLSLFLQDTEILYTYLWIGTIKLNETSFQIHAHSFTFIISDLAWQKEDLPYKPE